MGTEMGNAATRMHKPLRHRNILHINSGGRVRHTSLTIVVDTPIERG